MVNKEVVLDTIKKMKASGIEDSVISQTLQDIGLKDEEIKQYLAEVVSTPKSESVNSPSSSDLDDHLRRKSEEDALHQAMTQNKLEEHGEKIKTVHSDVNKINHKIDNLSSKPDNSQLASQLASINQKLFTLEKDISETKAVATANKIIMENILEANRKIISRL